MFPPHLFRYMSTDSKAGPSSPEDEDCIEELLPDADDLLGVSEERLNDKSKDPPEAHRRRAIRRCGGTCCGCGALHHSIDGGDAIMHIHHRNQDPDRVPYHHHSNLTWYCSRCHRWQHQAPDPAYLSVELRQIIADVNLEHTWIQVLKTLSKGGPYRVSDIEPQVDLGSGEGVRFALYSLMSLDQRHEAVEEQIVAKDRNSGLFGLSWQLPESRHSRGTVPESREDRRIRVRDEVALRLNRQLSACRSRRKAITKAVNRSKSQTTVMERRAQAFQFPFDQWISSKWYRGREEPLAVLLDILGPEESEEPRPETIRRMMLIAESVEAPLSDRLAVHLSNQEDW